MEQLPDIYFMPEYGRLYETHEKGKLEVFSWKTPRGEVYFQFIRRPLDQFWGFEGYSDIVTPYGYGGPVILGAEDGDKKALAAEFGKAFREYCRESKTVSAFIRFHPILGNALDFTDVFDDVALIRKTVAVDLSKDLMRDEFENIARRNYRSALKRPLTLEIDTEGEKMDEFVGLYYELMGKKSTSSYYFFPKEYFNALKQLNGRIELACVRSEGSLVASVLFLKYGQYYHAHLGGSTPAGNAVRATDFLYVSMALHAQEKGFRWNHLGGGISNDPEDSLLRFKRKFSKTTPFDFYIGKNVYEPRAYEALCALTAAREKQVDDSYFPKYRA
jgi:lipid II:glycine glycyltransferase (peptidoglycan interpeptide bridge formation enzyme)